MRIYASLKKIRSQGPNKKLICSLLILDPDSMIAHIEPAMYVFGKALDSLKDSSDLTDLEKRSVVQVRNICFLSPFVLFCQNERSELC